MSLAAPLRRIDEAPYCSPPRAALAVARLALAAATLISGYLLYTAWTQGTVAGCGDGSSCESVLKSRFGQWFGVPVSLLAVVVYLTGLAGLAMVGPRRSAGSQRDAWRVVIVVAAAVTAAAIWFVGVQVYLQAFCPWCMAAHSLGLTAAAVAFLFGPLRAQPAGGEAHGLTRPMRRRVAAALSLLGTLGVAALATGQVLGPEPPHMSVELMAQVSDGSTTRQKPVADAAEERPSLARREAPPSSPAADGSKGDSRSSPKSRVVEPARSAPDGTQDPPPAAGDATTSSPPDSKAADGAASGGEQPAAPAPSEPLRPITALDIELPKFVEEPPVEMDAASDDWDPTPVHQDLAMGSKGHSVDLINFPVIGSRQAKFVAAEFFDYTCSHCRSLYHSLEQARKRYGSGQFALVMVPVPMNKSCNQFVQTTADAHKEACRYTMLALAIWKIDPHKFAAFHDYLMGSTLIPTIDEAYREALRSVDETTLHLALDDKWIKERIIENTKMYKAAGAGKIPKLMCGPYMVVGEPKDEQELFSFLENRWGLRPRKASPAKP